MNIYRHSFYIAMIAILSGLLCQGCIFRNHDKSKMIQENYRLFEGTEAWPLASAAKRHNFKKVGQILSRDPSLVNIRDSIYGNTILMLAIMNEDYELFKILIRHNPDINYYNHENRSPIHTACFRMKTDVRFVRDLVEAGANVNDSLFSDQTGALMSTPLSLAIYGKDQEIVEYLIEKGADVNFISHYGNTPLGLAILFSEYQYARILMENGADYSKPVSYELDGKGNREEPTYLLQELRYATPSPYSREFLNKRDFIKYLRQRGIDYDSEPIPEYVVKEVKSKYPLFWKLYLKYY